MHMTFTHQQSIVISGDNEEKVVNGIICAQIYLLSSIHMMQQLQILESLLQITQSTHIIQSIQNVFTP